MKNILKKLAQINEDGTDIKGILVILITLAILLLSLIAAIFTGSPIMTQLFAFGLIITILSGMGWLLFVTACIWAETIILYGKPNKVS